MYKTITYIDQTSIPTRRRLKTFGMMWRRAAIGLTAIFFILKWCEKKIYLLRINYNLTGSSYIFFETNWILFFFFTTNKIHKQVLIAFAKPNLSLKFKCWYISTFFTGSQWTRPHTLTHRLQDQSLIHFKHKFWKKIFILNRN